MTNESMETRVTTDELNRRLHEAMGLCWHDDTTFEFADKAPPYGWFYCKCGETSYTLPFDNHDYTTSLDAAFELIEWMKGEGFDFELIGNSGQVWIVEIAKDDGQPTFTTHTSLPTAIATACYAALREGK